MKASKGERERAQGGEGDVGGFGETVKLTKWKSWRGLMATEKGFWCVQDSKRMCARE